ncbi:MAG: flavin oxidoreductase / oxidase family protein, partial [Devosia sp.]|nr:flavin oxidoreductase / oxidase family protein [Devosia sp.]
FIEAGHADALAFGRDYIATPDLAERLLQELPLNTPNKDTFYGEGREGDTDYPRLLP